MLVLKSVEGGYPDDADPAIRYRLPTGLTPLAGPDGTPQAVLARGDDGGLLHLRLGAIWPPFAASERPVPLSAARFRLLLQTPGAGETGRWRDAIPTGDTIVDRSVSLEEAEAAIAKHLGQRGSDLVTVEVELTLRGLAPAFPWLASVQLATLHDRIAALLRATPATWEDVEAAFLGLTEDTFQWYPLEPRAIAPPRDEALLAIAHYAAVTLLTPTEGGWRLADGGPSKLDLNLAQARMQTRTVGLRWSFSEFLAAQPDPSKHLIEVAVPAPFVAADLSVVNDVPLAASGVRSVAFEAQTGGPTGRLHHEFLPGEPAAARLRFVRQTTDPLNILWRTRTTIVTGSGPAVIESPERRGGLMIDVDAVSLGIKPLRFAAARDLFDYVVSAAVTVGSRTLTLTAAAPEAWAIGREPPASVAVSVTLQSGKAHSLGDMTVGPAGLTIDASALGIGDVVPVVLKPPANLPDRAAYLAVQVDGYPWRTLDAGAEVRLPIRRPTRLEAPRLRYRTRIVARDTNGATRALDESTWHDAAGDVISIEV